MATTPPDLRRNHRLRRRHSSSANFTIIIIIILSFLLTILITASAAQIINVAGKSQFREAHKFYNSPVCPDLRFEDSADAPLCSDAAIHVAMTLDSDYLRGSTAAIHSILHHSACPENVFFHFIASSNSSLLISLRSLISSSFPYLRFRVYPFDDDSVSDLISTSIRPALDRPLNYARSYLASLLPDCVQRAVYLDSDVILVDDISKLWSALSNDNKSTEEEEEEEQQDQESGKSSSSSSLVLAAPEYCNANFTSYFTAAFWSSRTLSLTFASRRACYFNTGVMVINLRLWRKGDYTARIEEWMELQKRVRIYQLGSLPPFLLVFAGKIKPVDHRWNQHGLGGDNFRGLCRNLHPGPVSLLHWSGKGKPWVRLDANRPCPLDALWAPYDLFQTPFFLDS